jgi:hypothetical protein
VTDTDLLDSNFEAIQFIASNTTDIHFTNIKIAGAATFAIQYQSHATGTIKNVVASGIGRAGTYNCQGPDALLGLVDQGGNSGFATTYWARGRPRSTAPTAGTRPRHLPPPPRRLRRPPRPQRRRPPARRRNLA